MIPAVDNLLKDSVARDKYILLTLKSGFGTISRVEILKQK